MTITEPYTTAAVRVREATEQSAQSIKETVKAFTDRAAAVNLPEIDLNTPVQQYFDYAQQAVDLNREIAVRWVEIVSALTDSVRDRAQRFTSIVNEQADSFAELVSDQARKAEDVAKDQAQQIEDAEKEQARLARKAEREQAKKAHEEARERYEGLTKAELSDLLAERELPKSGTVEELVERLVEADTK